MKKILVTFTIILFTSSLFAQLFRFNSGGMISAQWNMAKPMGSMTDFVKNTSFTGMNIDYRHCYKNNIILGGRTGWNNFYENRKLLIIEDGEFTSYKNIQHKVITVPIMFVVDYMVNSDKIIPYAGVGIGAYYIGQSTVSNNVSTESNNSFHFGVSPELGITIPFIVSNFGLNVSSRYNYALGNSKSDSYSWFDFSIGISFMY